MFLFDFDTDIDNDLDRFKFHATQKESPIRRLWRIESNVPTRKLKAVLMRDPFLNREQFSNLVLDGIELENSSGDLQLGDLATFCLDFLYFGGELETALAFVEVMFDGFD